MIQSRIYRSTFQKKKQFAPRFWGLIVIPFNLICFENYTRNRSHASFSRTKIASWPQIQLGNRYNMFPLIGFRVSEQKQYDSQGPDFLSATFGVILVTYPRGFRANKTNLPNVHQSSLGENQWMRAHVP